MAADALHKLVEAYRSNPPKKLHECAAMLETIWNARADHQREELKLKSTYWTFPELPSLTASFAGVCMTFRNAERKGFHLQPLWQFWDQHRELPPHFVKGILAEARKASGGQPGITFDQALADRLQRRNRSLQTERSSAMSRVSSRFVSNDFVELVLRMPLSKLGERARRLISVTTSATGLSTLEYVSELAARDGSDALAAYVTSLLEVDGKKSGAAKLVDRPFKRAARRATAASTPVKRTPTKKDPEKAIAKAPPSDAKVDPNAPPLRLRLKEILLARNNQPLGIGEAIAALTARNWLPHSKDLPAYISLAFSQNTGRGPGKLFERLKRGRYRVCKDALRAARKPVQTVKTNGAKNGASSDLFDALGSLLQNPFAGAAA